MVLNQKFKHGLAHCPTCSTALVAPFGAAGKPARCKSCRSRFQVPSSEELFEEAVAYLIERESDGRVYDPFDVEFDHAS
jgi:transposase-like protein